MDDDEARKEAARKYHDRITLRCITSERVFTRRLLTPRDGHRALKLPITPGEHGSHEGGVAHAYVEFNEPGETMELTFYGVGEPRDGVVARIWGVDRVERPATRPATFLCDIHAHLWENQSFGHDTGPMPHGTRLAQWVEVVDDHSPFPGIHLGYINGTTGGSPWIFLPDAWDFSGFLIEMALANPSGGPAARAAGALWRSFYRPKPKPIPPEMLDPNFWINELREQSEDERRQNEGEEWKEGPDPDRT